LAVIVGEIATEQDPRAYKPEVVRGYKAYVDLFGHAVFAGQCERKCEDACEALEFVFGGFTEIDKIGVGKGEVFDAAIAHIGGDDNELVGILIRKGTEQYRIGDAEDGRARTDAQGDG
jgi:hypothetical protein